jgi:hypothetical protein
MIRSAAGPPGGESPRHNQLVPPVVVYKLVRPEHTSGVPAPDDASCPIPQRGVALVRASSVVADTRSSRLGAGAGTVENVADVHFGAVTGSATPVLVGPTRIVDYGNSLIVSRRAILEFH